MHPWAMVIGVLAAALPIVVHFLTRPRPVRMPLSTVRFVREVVYQRRARHRLRDWLVLLLRAAAVLLIALAIARPQWGTQSLVGGDDSGDALRVVLIDASQSMSVTDGGVQLMERARTAAAEHLSYRPGLRANLIVAAATPASVFEFPSTNFEALRDELRSAVPLPQRLDARRALEAAAKMLATTSEADERRRELIVVSDFQRRNWAAADFSVLPRDTKIQLEPIRAADSLDNVAVVRAESRGRVTEGRPVQVEIDVGNFGRANRDVTVEIVLGATSQRVTGHCAAGRVTTLAAEVASGALGWQWGEARLVGVDDALAADNTRPIAWQCRAKPHYALITRQPAALRPSSSHFLECALVPDASLGDRTSARLTRVKPETLDRQFLATADLIVLDHPGRLDQDSIRTLAGLLRRGRPVLYVTSEPTDAANLKLLTESAGRGLQLPVEFAPPPVGQPRRDLFLTSFQRNEGIFSPFGDQAGAAVAPLRFSGGLASRRVEAGLASDMLATYNDGSAAIVLAASDAGSLAILNADLVTSSLPTTGTFLPLVEELVARLIVRQRAGKATCGEPLVAQLPADVGLAAGLSIVPPPREDNLDPQADAATEFGDLSDDGAGVAWHWNSPTAPGVYRVARDSKTEYALPIALSEDESQLDPLAMDVLTTRLAGGRAIHVQLADDESGRDSLWTWVLVICIGCMIGEVAALTVFRS
jgi:hypothetical protein